MRLSATRVTAAAQGRGLGNQLWDLAGNRPSLDLRFADDKSLVDATTGTNLVQFTRASNGTYVGSDGLIKTAVTNLLLRSEEFDTTWASTNSSETPAAGIAPNGANTAWEFKDSSDVSAAVHLLQQTVSFTSGIVYTLSIYAKAASIEGIHLLLPSAAFGVDTRADYDLVNGTASVQAGTVTASIQDAGNGWYRCIATSTASSTASAAIQLRTMKVVSGVLSSFYQGDGNGSILIWGAQLEQWSTVGEYIPTTSTINSAPRFDHDPTTGESLGLLVEESRTNLVLQSQDFATHWAATSASVSTNTTTAPDGTLTADTITASGSTLSRVFQTVTFTGDGDKAISVWLKAGTAPTSVIRVDDSSAGFVSRLSLTIAWTNGAPTGTTFFGTLQGIDAFPNGWYRIRALATGVIAANTNRYRIEADATNGTGSVIAWGAQAENGSSPTSYIPTEGSAVTRAADVATDTTRGAAIRSLYAQFRSPASGIRPVVSLDDDTANERIELFTSGTDPKLLVTDGGSTQADLDAGSITANTTARLAARFNTDNFAASVSGGAEVLDATGTMPTVDRIRIGRDQAGNCLNGTIARITGWDSPLPLLPTITQ